MKRRRVSLDLRQLLIAGVLSLVMVWLLFLVAGIARKEEIARKAADDTRAELALLSEREETLTANVAELRTERGKEGALRETYGVARPGEEVIIVVPPGEEKDYKPLPWWRKFMGFFGL